MNNTPIPVSFECFDYPGPQPNPVGHGSIHDTHHRYSQQIPTFVPPNDPPPQVFPETECSSSKPVPESAKLCARQKYVLLELLTDWNMKFLFKTLNEALIGIEALQYITPAQCESLLSSYPLGIRIKFTAKLTHLQREYKRVMECEHPSLIPMFANTHL